jgi:hypothetical protein
VKTYPIPSSTYAELVCCAGIDAATGDWIRMYPVNFRSLEQYRQFRKWQFIDATWGIPHNDARPESRRIHQDSIQPGPFLEPGKGWPRRRRWLDPIVDRSVEALELERQASRRSLGVIRPAKIHRLVIRKADLGAKARTDVQQLTLALTGSATPTGDLELIPYDFIYEFSCDDPRCVKRHRMEIFDWEAGEAYRQFRRRYGESGWEERFRQKWGLELPATDLHLVLGTHHRFQSWMIVGVLYPPHDKVDERNRRPRRNRRRQEGAMTLPGFGLEAE